MSDDLLFKVSADVASAQKGIEAIQAAVTQLTEHTKEASHAAEGLFSLEGLHKIGEASEKVFDVLKEQLTGSIEAYGESEDASRRLALALQNQGIYTRSLNNDYHEYAKTVSELSGIKSDEIVKAQAVAQSFLGQIPVTEELTQAIADLAVKEGYSLPQAAEVLGKAIGNGTGQLLRMGVQFASTDTEAVRYQKTLDFVSVKAGGFAEAANQGVGSLKGLQTALHENAEELGSRFAPAYEFAIEALTNLVKPAEDGSEEIMNLKASLAVAGLALSGVGVVLPIVAQGMIALKAATTAFKLEVNATKIALAGIGIGLLIIALTELVLHWEAVSGRVKAIVQGLVTYVVGYFSGLGKVLSGAFHLDTDKIKEGIKDIANAFKEGVSQATASLPEETEKALDKQDAVKKKFADKEAKLRTEKEAARIALQKAENEAIQLELDNASQKQIELKKLEIETLKALEKSKTESEKQLLKERVTQVRDLEEQQQAQDLKRDEDFRRIKFFAEADADLRFVGMRKDLNKKELAEIKAGSLTQVEAQRKVYADELKSKVAAHNMYLEEQAKYGIAYAIINQGIQSSEVQGTKKATGELVQLTQSKHQTLKSIGKAASVAQIVIKTGESAMNAFAGFSAIPIFGIPLGIAAAAAAIAFGAEQVDTVLSAQTGGIVPGVGSGDIVPAMLEPGELVAPKKNFDEVINGMIAQRGGQTKNGGEVKGEVGIKVGFDGPQASRVITIRQNEDKALGISRARS